MCDCMSFPTTWEQFLHDYEFEDSKRIYTNGARLIPSFRVKQMMEHYLPAADVTEVVRCRECKHYRAERGWYYCAKRGAGMTIITILNDDDFCSYGERKDGET